MNSIMNSVDISFPHLGIYLENVPKSFKIFGFTIALYGVVIALGMMLALMLCMKVAKKYGQDPDLYLDFSIYAIVISVICARIYYVIFSWDLYKNDLLSILNIRNGGLAIYGGVIGGFGTLFIYSRLKKVSFFQMGDISVLGLLLGQIMGRWGNFFNREAFGEYTDSLFAMRLPIDAVRVSDISEKIAENIVEGTNYIQVHPTFLYESVWNLCVLGLLLFFTGKKKFEGEIILGYLGLYGLGRFLIEGIRTDQLLIPGTNLAVSQMLALCMVIFSIVTEIIVRVKMKKKRTPEAEKAKK